MLARFVCRSLEGLKERRWLDSIPGNQVEVAQLVRALVCTSRLAPKVDGSSPSLHAMQG